MMGLAIVVLLYFSLRRWSDVAIVMFALGAALLWMQGLIGHFANLDRLAWIEPHRTFTIFQPATDFGAGAGH